MRFFELLHLLRLVLRILGLACLYGLLLYEDEEGRIQNKVEEWWIKLSDIQHASHSWATAFMQGVANLTERGFDRLFGRRFLSPRVVGVSLCLSLASLFMVLIIEATFAHSPQVRQLGTWWLWALFAWFAFFGIVPALVREWRVRIVWWTLIGYGIFEVGKFALFVYARQPRFATLGTAYILLAFGASLVVDIFYIAIYRKALRRLAKAELFPGLALLTLTSLLAVVIAVWLPIKAGIEILTFAPGPGMAVLLSFMLNSLDLVVASVAIILAVFLLLHRPVWSLARRILYPIARYAPVKRKKLLLTIGIALLFLPSHTGIEWLRELLEKL